MSGAAGAIMAGNEPLIFETGYCSVDRTLSKCFQLAEGFIKMLNFTEQICVVNERILCEEVQRDAAVVPPRSVITLAVDVLPGMAGTADTQELDGRQHRILFTVLALVALSSLIVVTITGLMWICRKGYCTKATRLLLPSTNSLVDYLTRMFSQNGATTPTGSISRLSVHEYAELQRKMEEAKADDETGINAGVGAVHDVPPLEDKATQTLPEELTQELLQSLKEKLNDPENYSEARDMIEHLYDLIKVEESCNRNSGDATVGVVNMDDSDREENLYDIIRPKRCSPPKMKKKKELKSTGTRAPSPDKLLPYTKLGISCGQYGTTMVADYIEPKDRRVHTYAELPHRPDLLQPAAAAASSDTKLHVYTELPANIRLANRPLPAHPLTAAATTTVAISTTAKTPFSHL